jgi:hypothetical protein
MKTTMKLKMILPALTEATGPHWRPIKYSLFPPSVRIVSPITIAAAARTSRSGDST